jgi:hypothetical protein
LVRWDPIAIDGVPEAEDEYDALISPLLHQLSRAHGRPTSRLGSWRKWREWG